MKTPPIPTIGKIAPGSLGTYVQTKLLSLLGQEMPHQGILAGPGMAAIALSFLWGREIPVEHMDLYKDYPDEVLEAECVMHYSRPSLVDDSYQLISQNGFSILDSNSKGLITTNVIQRRQANFGKDRTMVILQALDLNAFGVGYDCYSKQVWFTSDFAEFCRSRQLCIQSPVSAESLLALLQFQRVCGCYLDIEEEVELLAGYRKVCNKQGLVGVYDNSVSASGKVVYDKFKSILAPYCRLLEFEQPVLPGFEVSMGLQYQMVFSEDADSAGCENFISQFIQNEYAVFDSYVFTLLYNASLRKISSKVIKRRLKMAMSHKATTCMVLYNPECLQHDFADKHIQCIEQFRIIHPFCVNTLLSLGLGIVEMYSAISIIRAYSKRNGNQIVGLIETHKRIGYKLEEISKSSIEQLIETYRIIAGIPLIENQVDLSSFEYRGSVVELTTTAELEIEGWRMNNCVGGYAADLISNAGKTRIFHIDGMSPSTAAIYYKEDSRDVTFEVYGHSNRDALPEHLVVAERLGSYLINAVWNKNEPHVLLHNA